MPKMKIGEKVYEAKALNSMPLKHLMTFKADTRALGYTISWSDVESAAEEIEQLPEAEKEQHPLFELVYVAMIWATMLAAGDDIRFSDVVEIGLADIEFIEDPEPDEAGPTKGAKKGSPKASAAAK